MIRLFQKILLLVLVFAWGRPGTAQDVPANASSSLHDSLGLLLTYFRNHTDNEKLKQAVKEAQLLYTSDTLTDSLPEKLLRVENLLLNTSLNQQMTLSYAEIVMKVLRQLPPPGEHADYISSVYNLAYIHSMMGRYGQALPLYQKALAVTHKISGEDHPDYANGLSDIGNIYFNTGEFEKALTAYEQAVVIWKKVSEDDPKYAASLNNLGNLLQETGRYDKALPLLEKALTIRKKRYGENHTETAASISSLALLFYRMNRYDKALPLYQQALAIIKNVSGENNSAYAIALNNLALLYENMGQNDKALILYGQALTVFKNALSAKHPYYAAGLNNLALLYYSMGRYDKALYLYQQDSAITKEVQGEEHPDFAICLNNIGDLYLGRGKYGKALPYYRQAITIAKKTLGEEHAVYANSLHGLALACQNRGQPDSAIHFYQQALAIRKKVQGEEHPDYVSCLNDLGLLYSSLGNDTTASALLMKAGALKLQHLNQTYSILSEQEKITFLRKEASQFSYLPSLLYHARGNYRQALVKQVYASELIVKGMVLEDQQQVLQSVWKSGDTALLRLYEQWRFYKAFLGRQMLLPVDQRLPYADSLRETINQLEQQLSRNTTAFRHQQQRQNLTAADITRLLSNGVAAVEFITFTGYNKKWLDSTIYAALLLLPGDTLVRFIPLFEERQLKRLLTPSPSGAEAAIRQLYRGLEVENKIAGAKNDSLYQLIWKPLEQHLSGIHTVYYAPAGLLHRVAFQALHVDSTRFLIDKYQMNQVLSTRLLALPGQVSSHPATATLWGNIRYDLQSPGAANRVAPNRGSSMYTEASSFRFYTAGTKRSGGAAWAPLSGTRQEMDSIKSLLRSHTVTITDYTGAAATEEAFKALHGKSPHVLHVATHGFFLPVKEQKKKDAGPGSSNVFTMQQDPMFRSGLVLAGGNHIWKGGTVIAGREDGILTAYEIAEMDLSNTGLVVLSACETALGDLQGNEGVIGLQRAFKMAGVKQMILSLWRVPDRETVELMTLFYRNWLGGQSTREALRSAQLKMKERYPPYYWAAFVVVE